MHVLVVNGFADGEPHSHLADDACRLLESKGHHLDRIDLVGEGFRVAMSPEERSVYHDDKNLITEETQRSARLVGEVEALLFCYPTVTHTIPAVLKAWCERVLIPGVSFVFDDDGKVAPGMTNIRRLGAITVTPHGRMTRWRHGDLGYRTLLRTLRLVSHPRCRRTYVRLDRSLPTEVSSSAVDKAFTRW